MGLIPAPAAAFDFPADPPSRSVRLRGCFTGSPAILSAATPAEVPAVVDAAEAAALAGHWVLGGLSYGAAGAWDRAQVASRDDGPAAHFEVYAGAPEPWPDDRARLPALEWRPDEALADGLAPEDGVRRVIEHIGAGDCYQVNLTSRWRAEAPGFDLFDVFRALTSAQPGGYAIFSRAAGVASASPELFFARRGDLVVTQPMKGTAPADADPSVLAAPKERAENLMIVDLLRNDLGRVCLPGTVRVDALFELLRLPTVWQLTSTVTGRTPPGTTLADVFGALFPCGSVTGAPKLAAMRVIAGLEASPRGWYCGALGVIRPGGEAVFNVPIRTVVRTGDRLVCGVGSGIVADSDPDAELEEWAAKAAFLGGVPVRGLETMLLADGTVVHREEHLARLARTCRAHRLRLDLDHVRAAVVRAATAHPHGHHRLRVVAGGGPPDVRVSPAPAAGSALRLRLATEPLDTDGWFRPVIVHKTTHRDHYDRLRAAAGAGVDDVICVNTRGEVTECSLGNLAVRLDGTWWTPPEEVGLLAGIKRAELLASGVIRERRLVASDLGRAEGIAFLNDLRGWCPAILA